MPGPCHNDKNLGIFDIGSRQASVYADPQRFIYLLEARGLVFVKTFCILAPIIYE